MLTGASRSHNARRGLPTSRFLPGLQAPCTSGGVVSHQQWVNRGDSAATHDCGDAQHGGAGRRLVDHVSGAVRYGANCAPEEALQGARRNGLL